MQCYLDSNWINYFRMGVFINQNYIVMKLIAPKNIPEDTILFVKFSFNNVSNTKCASSNTYFADVNKFALQFAKIKDVVVTMEILSLHGKEKTN
jgi:hypothetical protein